MNTFKDILQDVTNRARASGKYYTSEKYKQIATNRILEGFEDLSDAKEFAQNFDYKFDIYGFQIKSDVILQAIEMKREWSPE